MTRKERGLSKGILLVDKNQDHRLLFLALLALGPCLLFCPSRAGAAAPTQAQFTQVVQDVQLALSPLPRAARLHESVASDVPIRTGANSWAELGFPNQTIARLGQNSVFSFKDGTHQLDLIEGAILLETPKAAKRSRLKMAGVAAEVTGATCVGEFHGGPYKFLVLQGTARLYRPGRLGDSILVHAGQMVIGQPGAPLSDPVDVDLGRFSRTSHFLLDFPPLASATLIGREAETQQRRKSKRRLIDTNLVIFGRGTSVSVLKPTQMNDASQANAGPSVASAIPGSNELGIVEIQPPPVNPADPTVLSGTRPSTDRPQ